MSHHSQGVILMGCLCRFLSNNKITSIASGAFAGLGKLTGLYVAMRCSHLFTTVIAHTSFYPGTWIHCPPQRCPSTCCQRLRCRHCMLHLMPMLLITDSIFPSMNTNQDSMPGTRATLVFFLCFFSFLFASSCFLLVSSDQPAHARTSAASTLGALEIG
jgi:hypothetical protein